MRNVSSKRRKPLSKQRKDRNPRLHYCRNVLPAACVVHHNKQQPLP